MKGNDFIHDNVRNEYGKIALENYESSILKNNISSEVISSNVGYTEEELAMAPEGAGFENVEIIEKPVSKEYEESRKNNK